MSSLKRFPEALMLAFAAVVVLICMNHATPGRDALTHAAMVLALGVPLALSIKMAFERTAVKWPTAVIVYVLAAAALLGYYYFLLPDTGMVAVSRYLGFTVALYLLFLSVPFLGRRDGFELYVIKLFTGFIVTYFYSLILYAGLAAIVFTIDALFGAGISGRVYADLWFIVGGIFAPAYFFAGIPAYGAVYHPAEYPKFLRILLLYIVMPLLSVYTGILYVYFIKILVTRHWPAGIVSHLVLWYSFISIAVIFFIYLLREKNNWSRIFSDYLPKLILPLLVMMFIAMGIRINAYGITENRYLVMTGGIWATGCMLYFAFKKYPRNIFVVLAAAIIAVLVVTGPWSCYSVSRYSQNARFEKILIRNDMLVDGRIVSSKEVPIADQRAISSIIQYFEIRHNLKELKYLPGGFELKQMREIFGFDLTYGSASRYFGHQLDETGELQDISGYDYFLYAPGKAPGGGVSKGSLTVAYDQSTKLLKISQAGNIIYQKDIAESALKIHADHIGEDILNNKAMTVKDENENLKLMLLFRSINGEEDGGNGRPAIAGLDYFLFVKLK
jgi:hypothetical protein